jgi:hypothetical protein
MFFTPSDDARYGIVSPALQGLWSLITAHLEQFSVRRYWLTNPL